MEELTSEKLISMFADDLETAGKSKGTHRNLSLGSEKLQQVCEW